MRQGSTTSQQLGDFAGAKFCCLHALDDDKTYGLGEDARFLLSAVTHTISILLFLPHILIYTHTQHTQPFYGCMDFVQDNPGKTVPEETHLNNEIKIIGPGITQLLHIKSYMNITYFLNNSNSYAYAKIKLHENKN